MGVRPARRVRIRPARDRSHHGRERRRCADTADSRASRGSRAHRRGPGARQFARVDRGLSMTVPRYARFASTLLSRIGAAAPPTPDPNDRARTIAAIARAIEASRRQRQARRWGMACAAAGVVVLAALGGYRLASRGAPVMVAIAPAASPVAQIVAHP